MAQLPLKQASWAIYVPKNDIFFAIFCADFSPFFFLNIKLLFWDIGVAPSMWAFPAWFWRNDGSCFEPAKVEPLKNPILTSDNGSSGHLLKFGFKASRPLLAKWRKLRHPCPKKDNSDVFPGGFASCPGTTMMSFLVVFAFCLGRTLIDVAYFG